MHDVVDADFEEVKPNEEEVKPNENDEKTSGLVFLLKI